MLVSGIQIMAADDDIHADAPGLHELLALRTCLAAHHGCADIVRAYYSSQLSIQQTNEYLYTVSYNSRFRLFLLLYVKN